MHKNILAFWQYLETLPEGHPDSLTPRVCRLLQEVFEKWHSKPKWIDFNQMGHLFDYYDSNDLQHIKELSIAERKGLAIKKMFEFFCNPVYREDLGTMEINADELIVGTLPPYSVGQGKELIRYLKPEEELFWNLRYLNEWSPFGHIVPDHEVILSKGIIGIIEDCQTIQANLSENQTKKYQFYQSVIDSLEGVLYYVNEYADLVIEEAILIC